MLSRAGVATSAVRVDGVGSEVAWGAPRCLGEAWLWDWELLGLPRVPALLELLGLLGQPRLLGLLVLLGLPVLSRLPGLTRLLWLLGLPGLLGLLELFVVAPVC